MSAATEYNLWVLGAAIGCCIVAVISAVHSSRLRPSSSTLMPLVALLAFTQGLMMLASSYVEEEHQYWYWIGPGLIVLRWSFIRRQDLPEVQAGQSSTILASSIAVLLRVSRRWNQTGQKWATEPDITKTFLTANRKVLWLLVLCAYIDISLRMHKHLVRDLQQKIRIFLAISISVAALSYKVSFCLQDSPELLLGCPQLLVRISSMFSLSSQARMVFMMLSLAMLFTVASKLGNGRKSCCSNERRSDDRAAHDLLSLFLITQTRTTNIPIFLIFRVLSLLGRNFSHTYADTGAVCCYIVMLQHFAFFSLGGSNAISTVDLSNAYNGITSYNALGVGFLAFVSNWSGPIWWASEGMLLLTIQRRRSSLEAVSSNPKEEVEDWDAWYFYAGSLTVFSSLTAAASMVACILLRHHLFVWTVFSPKYLYVIAWSLPMHIGINLGLSSFVYWLGTGS